MAKDTKINRVCRGRQFSTFCRVTFPPNFQPPPALYDLQIVITKNVDHHKGIVNASCGEVEDWVDTPASLTVDAGEKDPQKERPAYVRVRLTTGSGAGIQVHIHPYDETSVYVPSCRGVAVQGTYKVTQLPFMVAACMTIHRAQGVGFERVAVWIPLRGFSAQGQGYTAVSRAKSLGGLFLVIPDDCLEDREEAREFLMDAFQPPADAIDALQEMRERAPAIARVRPEDGVGREVEYATLWDSRVEYSAPPYWPQVSPWPSSLPVPEGYNMAAR